MDTREFQMVIDHVLQTLPAQFQDAIKDVAIVVEPYPAPTHGFINRGLLGLYQGVPATSWGRDYSGKLPDKISLFQENIELHAGAPENVPYLIRETLLHEIAHHFGFDHDRIHGMEQRWRQGRTDAFAG